MSEPGGEASDDPAREPSDDPAREPSEDPAREPSEDPAREPTIGSADPTPPAVVKQGQKRKAVEPSPPPIESARMSDHEDEDEGSYCNICMEPWTNSGDHRISSLKCGHFFGLACIEKWLKGGSGCPNCNEKASRKDLRVHYVARLKAIDTSERDRAVAELEKVKMERRQLELEMTTLKLTLTLQAKELEALRNTLSRQPGAPETKSHLQLTVPLSTSPPDDRPMKLVYAKRLEIIRSDVSVNDRDKCCRVLACNEFHGMLVVSQPSFTALAPGYGVRKINMLDVKAGSFVALHKEPIRDLAFNPVKHDLLLSASQEKCVKLTNISTGHVIQKYNCESEAWCCTWNLENLDQFFVGTKRSQILLFDTKDCTASVKTQLEFPVTERRPIISMVYIPPKASSSTFPSSGLVVQTLGSLWFFEYDVSHEAYKAHKLSLEGPFWSMRFDLKTRLLLVSTKPTPHSRHMVCEMTQMNISEDPTRPVFTFVCNVIYDQRRGGSYTGRSFLRSTLFTHPSNEQQLLLAFDRGSGQSDHHVIVQEMGKERALHDLQTNKPALDMGKMVLNDAHHFLILGETELIVYKWTKSMPS